MNKFIFLGALLLTFSTKIWAQGCSVCTQTANQLGEDGANGLNKGIVYLAFLPLTLILVIGYLWWRNNHSTNS